MTKKLEVPTAESLKQKLERDILIGGENDNLAPNTIRLYLRQMIKMFNPGLTEYSSSHDEFIDRVRFPRQYADAEVEKLVKTKKSDIISLLLSLYPKKESLILTLNALRKMTKNRYKQTFDYYSKIRKELSKQKKSEKLDNELTPEEAAKYISYDELMGIPIKVKSGIIKSYGRLFMS